MNQKLLNKLISFPTITNDEACCQSALHWCAGFLAKKGITSEFRLVTGRPILVWGDVTSPEIMINSHIDVVPAEADQFKAKLVKDKTLGRGAADTKAGVAALIDLPAKIIKKATERRIIFVLVSDEETGGQSSKELINQLTDLRFGLFLEPTNLEINNQAKGIMQVRISALGKSAHGSRPWAGENAIIKMSRHLVLFLRKNPVPNLETRRTTFNFSLIDGGSAINQVPGSCNLMIDIRFNPMDKPENILALLKESFPGCRVEAIRIESPIFCESDQPMVSVFCEAISKTGIKPRFSFEHGSSDARHCTAKGIPAIVFGPRGGNFHALGEWVDNQSVSLCQRIMINFIIVLPENLINR